MLGDGKCNREVTVINTDTLGMHLFTQTYW